MRSSTKGLRPEKGARPLVFVSEELTRRLLQKSLADSAERRAVSTCSLPPPWPVGRAASPGHVAGPGADPVAHREPGALTATGGLRRVCTESGVECERACEVVARYVERTEAHTLPV